MRTSSLSQCLHLHSSLKRVSEYQPFEFLESYTMKLNKGVINNLGASKKSRSPKPNVVSSSAKKLMLGKNHNRWFNTKSFYLGIAIYIAFVASMFSRYCTGNNSLNDSSLNDSSENVVIDGYTQPCLIKDKATISAINRTTSDSCKQRFAELACRGVDAPDGIGDLYATHLPSFCPPGTIVPYNVPGPGLLEWAPEWAPKLGKTLFEGDCY